MTEVSKNKLDTEHTDEIICPYCGNKISDSWEYNNNEEGEIHCDECENDFYYSVHISASYSTERLKCKDSCNYILMDRVYGKNPYIYGKYNWTIYQCTKCFHELDVTSPIAEDNEPYIKPIAEINR